MKIFSITVIFAAIMFAAIGINDSGTAFWNMLYGFAVMLAIFNILNLKIHWAAAFGAVAYAAIAYKLVTAPITTGHVNPSLAEVSGLIIASFYCLCLALSGTIKNRHPTENGMPEVSH